MLKEELEEFKKKRANELLADCTQRQQDFFKKVFPNGMNEDNINTVISLIERTLAKNKDGKAND